ncbi:MAG: hypothetical protein QM647_15270 [Asticcacaulis sp.]|uniref:DUF7831 domain-containing protein n=1 Tax=Asticcacaulis sp. TaxID=1872648 RepID=UPI0039E34B5D
MIIHQYRIYRCDLRANPAFTYVFGCNEARYGLGGQAAEMRGEKNAHGIATLRAPGVFWSDSDRARQCQVLAADFEPLFNIAERGGVIVLPIDGVGTGLARLEERAPQTFAYLQKLWKHLIDKGSK